MGEPKRDLPKPTPVLTEGIDLSLLRYMLGLPPLERLALMEKPAQDVPPSAPRLIHAAEVLGKRGVEFLVIGGTAAILWGSPLPTVDLDLCYRRTGENLVRLAASLAELHSSPRGAPADLKFRLDAEGLALGARFEFATDLGALDLFATVEPFGGYDRILPRAVEMELGPARVRVIGLEDLIRTRRSLGRPQDRPSYERLTAIRELMRESAGPEKP